MTIKHTFWNAGEDACPQDLRAANGDLHTLQCKVCGEKNPLEDFCSMHRVTDEDKCRYCGSTEHPINVEGRDHCEIMQRLERSNTPHAVSEETELLCAFCGSTTTEHNKGNYHCADGNWRALSMELYLQRGGEMVPLAKDEEPHPTVQHWVKAECAENLELELELKKWKTAAHNAWAQRDSAINALTVANVLIKRMFKPLSEISDFRSEIEISTTNAIATGRLPVKRENNG